MYQYYFHTRKEGQNRRPTIIQNVTVKRKKENYLSMGKRNLIIWRREMYEIMRRDKYLT